MGCATTAQFTSVRVVCNNTLTIALCGTAGTVKVPHRRAFDAQAVKQQLGVAIIPWSSFSDHIKAGVEFICYSKLHRLDRPAALQKRRK
jgi:hypothetical protein